VGPLATVLFFVGILVIILIHEAGHYIAARGYGFKVEQYFVGFGPKVWSFRRGEIEYGVKALPLGGYVKIAGMNPYEPVADADLPRAYGSKPRWQRALVIFAGPGSHFVVAALLFAFVASAAAQVPVPGDPPLRPGDMLRVNVWRHPELSGDFAVAPDSTLVHPLYQTVKVAGAPLTVVRARLLGLLAPYEQGVDFVIEPLFAVTVAGEVRQPNLYQLPQGTTFAQAIARAGGPTELGRLDEVHVIRRDRTMVINLAQDYSRYEGVPVASGDQVLVARRSNYNFLRDFLYPVASLTAAVAAVLAYSRYR